MFDNLPQVQLDVTSVDGILALVRNDLEERGHDTAGVGAVSSPAGGTGGHVGSAGDTDDVTSRTTGDRRLSGDHVTHGTLQ